jgi:hypothetical protein
MHRRPFILVSVMAVLLIAGLVDGEESGGVFPLGRSLAGDRDLPRPFGIGLNFYHQTQDYRLRSLRLNLPFVDMTQATGIDIENRTNEFDLKADLWVLPFLNVFALAGNVEGETTVNPGPPLSELQVDYEGLVYGAGVTIAAGGKLFFGSVTAVVTETDLDTATSSVNAWVLTPRFGVHFDRMAFWIGGMYQEAEERHEGRITVPMFGEVTYDVEMESAEPWNFVAGLTANLSKHWELEVEGGLGDRQHALISIGYRF